MRQLAGALRLVLVLIAAEALLVGRPAPAVAQDSGWSLALALPLDARFNADPQVSTPDQARFPVGLRATVLPPLPLGFGISAYRSGFASDAFPFAGRRLELVVAEVQGVLREAPYRFGIGLGRGTARFNPVSASSMTLTQEYQESPVWEWFLGLGYRLDERWEVDFAVQTFRIDLRYRTNGAPAEGNLELQVISAGAAFRF